MHLICVKNDISTLMTSLENELRVKNSITCFLINDIFYQIFVLELKIVSCKSSWLLKISLLMLQILCKENLFFKKYFLKNPFHATGLFLYHLKTSENLGFSDVFREYRKSQWHQMS